MSLVFRVLLTLAAAVPAAADVTDRVSRTAPLAPGTPITLEVTVGRIRVSGWDRPELSVEIERSAPDATRLARIFPQIDTAGAEVSIRVVQPDGDRDPSLRSDVVLRVPRMARLGTLALFEGRMELDGLAGTVSAHVERGDVVARNIAGTIRVETGMGDIRLEGAVLSPDGLMRLRTFNGNVSLELAERPANARVLALSMGGSITSDFALTRQERWGPRWAETTIGTGEPLISIDVVNGDIAVKVAK
jgi:hypothetical protein